MSVLMLAYILGERYVGSFPETCNDPEFLEKNPGQYMYSQLSLRRTPLGPALAVRLREMSVL